MLSAQRRPSQAGARFGRDRAAKVRAATATASGTNDTPRTTLHPYDVSTLPDKNDPKVMVPNTQKSLSDYTRARSSGR